MTHPVSFESLDLSMPGGRCDAYLAHPSGGGPWPRVLLIMDAVGLRPQIADMVSRVASWGYAVLAPNTFYRVGRQPLVDPTLLTAERRADRMARFGELIPSLSPAMWAVDGPAYLDHLAALDVVRRDEPARIVGYCMGGRLALALAAQETVAAAARATGCDLVGELYADAAHGFTMADLPAHHADAEARHWRELERVFAGG